MNKHIKRRLSTLERRAKYLEQRVLALPIDARSGSYDWAEWSAIHFAIKIITDYYHVVPTESQLPCCDEHDPSKQERQEEL